MTKSSNFWLFKKHWNNIQLLDFDYVENIRRINSKMNLELSEENVHHARLNWAQVPEVHFFPYDYVNSQKEISKLLLDSELANSQSVLIETTADEPIIKTNTRYFASNWFELTCSLVGMGSIVVSDDYRYLIEITDDAFSMIYSNFLIKK